MDRQWGYLTWAWRGTETGWRDGEGHSRPWAKTHHGKGLGVVGCPAYWSGHLVWGDRSWTQTDLNWETDRHNTSAHKTKLYLVSSGSRDSNDVTRTLCSPVSQHFSVSASDSPRLFCVVATWPLAGPDTLTGHLLTGHHFPSNSCKITGWSWLGHLEAPDHLQSIPVVEGILYFHQPGMGTGPKLGGWRWGQPHPSHAGWKQRSRASAKGTRFLFSQEKRMDTGQETNVTTTSVAGEQRRGCGWGEWRAGRREGSRLNKDHVAWIPFVIRKEMWISSGHRLSTPFSHNLNDEWHLLQAYPGVIHDFSKH